MKNIWKKLSKPFLALAPMAGYTDQPFRLMCKEYGADLLYSEMISSEAIWHNKVKGSASRQDGQKSKVKIKDGLYKTLSLIQFSKEEKPYIVQIFGNNIEHINYAGKYIAYGEWKKDYLKYQKSNIEYQKCLEIGNWDLEIASIPQGIDVNMGCPVRDVVQQGAGSALLRDMDKAVEIVKQLKKQVNNVPISVKTRLGWSDHKDILIFSRMLECAGVDAIAIHGRTYKEGFSGKVDYEIIEKVKKQVKIPVIANGGITIENWKLITENCKVDGYMIGTGALGKPWIIEQIKNQKSKIKNNDINFIKKNILEHAKMVQDIKGEKGIVEFRKHLAWYLKGIANIKQARVKLMQVNNYQEIKELLSGLKP